MTPPASPMTCFSGVDTAPLSGAEFAALMSVVGPFEGTPHIAVAVSGGADSLCLCLMMADWARTWGGRVTALSVDHGLRADSAWEVERVASWLRARDVDHVGLRWEGTKPASGLQAAARDARYALMLNWCQEKGVLHLALGHHADDQAETYLMRRAHGSGPDGLAGMASIVEMPQARLLRPLLHVPRARLAATLRSKGQAWIEDPSNDNMAFERVRIRQARATVPETERKTAALLARAQRFAQRRIGRESDVSTFLAQRCELNSAGVARLWLENSEDETARSAFARVLMTVGGRSYPPSAEKVARAVASEAGTLAGCRWQRDRDRKLIWRENRGLPKAVAAAPTTAQMWDNRFKVRVSSQAPSNLRLAPLGENGWQAVAQHIDAEVKTQVPYAARLALPAFWDGEGVFALPSMDYIREGEQSVVSVAFRPVVSLGGIGFASLTDFPVAPREKRVISKEVNFGRGANECPASYSEG